VYETEKKWNCRNAKEFVEKLIYPKRIDYITMKNAMTDNPIPRWYVKDGTSYKRYDAMREVYQEVMEIFLRKYYRMVDPYFFFNHPSITEEHHMWARQFGKNALGVAFSIHVDIPQLGKNLYSDNFEINFPFSLTYLDRMLAGIVDIIKERAAKEGISEEDFLHECRTGRFTGP